MRDRHGVVVVRVGERRGVARVSGQQQPEQLRIGFDPGPTPRHQRRAADVGGCRHEQLGVTHTSPEAVDHSVELLVGVATVGVDHRDAQVEGLVGHVTREARAVHPVQAFCGSVQRRREGVDV